MNEHRAQHAAPLTPSADPAVQVGDHPDPQGALRGVLGEIVGPHFWPAVGFAERVALARRSGLGPEDAHQRALAGLATDEALLRACGLTWRVVEVTARVGCGEHTVSPVFTCYPQAVQDASALALSLARQDAADWARLGLN